MDVDQHLSRTGHGVVELAERQGVDAVEAAADDGAHLSPALSRAP
jgi:hypothetical protein